MPLIRARKNNNGSSLTGSLEALAQKVEASPTASDTEVLLNPLKPNASDVSLSSVTSSGGGSAGACECLYHDGKKRRINWKTNPDGCVYYERSASQRQLYMHHQVPPILKYNSYIRSGYRAGFDYAHCMCSVFEYHNETGNILSHLLPLLLLFYGLISGYLQPWEAAQLAYYVQILSTMTTLALSVAYHTFAGNHHTYSAWLQLDVCGILTMLIGGATMPLWWGLHCGPGVKLVFTISYYACWSWCLYAALRAETAKGRGMPLLLLLFIRMSSLAIRFWIGGPLDGLKHYITAELFVFVGGLINASRVPERWFQPKDPNHPGLFDYWLNSHQIMHFLVVGAMYELYRGAYLDYNHFQNFGDDVCPIS